MRDVEYCAKKQAKSWRRVRLNVALSGVSLRFSLALSTASHAEATKVSEIKDRLNDALCATKALRSWLLQIGSSYLVGSSEAVGPTRCENFLAVV